MGTSGCRYKKIFGCVIGLALMTGMTGVFIQDVSAAPATDARVQKLLEKARVQIIKKKLTTPYKDNAFETLQQVKRLDPGNPEIDRLTEEIKRQYKIWIAEAEKKGQKEYARLFCYRYLTVDPQDAEIKALLDVLNGTKEKKTAPPSGADAWKELTSRMIKVPGGLFTMGSNETFPPDRKPEHSVYVSTFYIDKYETTNAEFAEFLNAQGNPESAYIKLEYSADIVMNDGKYSVAPGRENYPVNFVSWYGADAYCRWRGKRLLTEAEWEKASRGEFKQKYSWGSAEPSPALGNFIDSMNWRDVLKPVDAYESGKSAYGVLNMSGSVWEWCSDWYDATYYSASPEKNPKGPAHGTHKVLRGGQAGSRKLFLEVSYRNHNVPGLQSPYTGCRCGLSAKE